MGRPKEFENDPSHYQIKRTQDIQPNRFDVSYGRSGQVVEAMIRKELGPAVITVNVVGQNDQLHRAAWQPAPAGERYNEVKGYYFERRRATIPATIGTRDPGAGDIVNVIVKAGGLQQEFRYRVEATPDPGRASRPRSACSWSPPRTTPASRRTSTRATTPRRATCSSTSPRSTAAGYEVDTFNIDAPPANGGTPNGVCYPPIKYPTQLGVLSHFDAVNYYTGDDFVPQEVTETNPVRRVSRRSATVQTGSARDVAAGPTRS